MNPHTIGFLATLGRYYKEDWMGLMLDNFYEYLMTDSGLCLVCLVPLPPQLMLPPS